MIAIWIAVACLAAAMPKHKEVKTKPRVYYARGPDGRLLADEKGHSLKFDSLSAAEATPTTSRMIGNRLRDWRCAKKDGCGMIRVVLGRIAVAAGLLWAAAYMILILDAARGSFILKEPAPAKYRYTARATDGHLLADERGEALRFDSKQAADDYAAQYQKRP